MRAGGEMLAFCGQVPGKISIVVPCYNEEAVLPLLFARVLAAAPAWGADYEAFARNFGHQTAVSAGLHFASGDAVVVMDADLQDPPEAVAALLAQWRAGFEVVFATRKQRQDPFVKRLLAWGFYRLLQKMTPLPMAQDAGDFCLLDRKVVAVIKALPERSRYLRGLRTWCGFRQTSVAFDRDERAAGVPQYTFRKSL